MKAVIIGTDFVKDNTGTLKIVETNTNVDVHNVIVPDLDWASFKQFLIDNSISKLHFIYTDGNFINTERATKFDTHIPKVTLKDKLEEVITEVGGTFTVYEVAKNSITVPYVEDADDTLILRTSYDTTAIIDENYAKDKVNFHRAISNQTFSTKIYYNSSTDTSLNVDDLIELHLTDGDAPNYIVKTRYPNTDYVQYPKLYKINSLEDLGTLKASLTSSEYLEEFHSNNDNVVEGKMGVIRSLDIIYGSTLSCLHLGSYVMTSPLLIDVWETTYDSNGKMNQNARPLWISKSPNQRMGISYILDDDTPILYADGNFKYPNQILENHVLKTVTLNWVPLDDTSETGEPLYIPNKNSGSFSEDLTTFGTTNTNVVSLVSELKESLMIRVTLENGLVYEDLPHSAMLIEEYDTLRTIFSHTNEFRVNDSVIFYDYNNNTLVKSKITNLEITYANRRVYDIDVEENDIFLPLADENLGITFIQHNPCQGWCGLYSCSYYWCNTCSFCFGPIPKL
jgi:hypothetical protein